MDPVLAESGFTWRTAATEHTGAMIALVPSDAHASALALEGGEHPGDLHLTLMFLGEGADWFQAARDALVATVASRAPLFPVYGRTFGVNMWNPSSDSPAWVWPVSDDAQNAPPEEASTLVEALGSALDAVGSVAGEYGMAVPEQHSPWVPHVTAVYCPDMWPMQPMQERIGSVTFDRIRVAFAGDYVDIPLMPEPSTDVLPGEPGPIQVGDTVTVAPGAAHEEDHVGATGVVEEINPGPAYGIRFEGTDMVHRWYVGQELERSVTASDWYGGDTTPVGWHTPAGSGLAFENRETGDGRLFRPNALYWEDGPWPLQYAEHMGEGHDGAELAGSIESMRRMDEGALDATGVLYPSVDAGAEAMMLLSRGAPLGVSVDLDDVTVEFVDRSGEPTDAPVYVASAATMSVLRTPNGWSVTSRSEMEWTASGDGLAGTSTVMRLLLDDDGAVPVSLLAAAGDPDPGDGLAVMQQSAGDVLMRVTRARVRGATLVSMPAFAGARIELDQLPPAPPAPPAEIVASGEAALLRVVDLVIGADRPMKAADVAFALGLPMEDARGHLSRASQEGMIVRLTRSAFTAPLNRSVTAAATGSTDLPIADRNTGWDSTAAQTRVKNWADGDGAKLRRAYLWVDPSKDAGNVTSYKLQFADVIGGELTVVPRAVFAVAAVLQGARGGVDIPEADMAGVKNKVEALYSRMEKKFGTPLQVPWAQASGEMAASVDAEGGEPDDDDDALTASAWAAVRDLPPMPADWFREPTVDELPPGAPGMNYSNGRVFGWVAQAGEPHAGYAKKITIDSLGAIDTTHFLRQRFSLDDGSTVKAGAFVMNTGHHRDGAECETSSCAFDDSRTVAAIVTVGMNERGMWFSGAAHPALSEWDRQVFHSLNPSYHMIQRGGTWQLRGILAVPVPGHSSPLLASAVIDRTNLALMASAAMALPVPEEAVDDVVSAQVAELDYDRLADAIVASMARTEERKAAEAAELEALLAEAADLDAEGAGFDAG